jgi:hypothetical protein
VQTRRRLARGGALVALAVASFAIACALLRPVLPGGGGLERTETKLAHYAEHADEFDTLFLGSSRTFRGFDPETFDRVTAENGVPTRSFNFGIPGNRAVEIQHLLGRIVALEPRGVRFVLVDPEGLTVMADTRNFRARDVIDWHDFDTTAIVSGHVLRSEGGTRDKIDLLGFHWSSYALNVTNVGRGLGWTDPWLGRVPTKEFVLETVGARGDGYAPLGEEGAELGRRGRRFRSKRVDDYLARLEDFRALAPLEGEPSPAALALYERIESRASELGAATVFVTQPALYLQHDLIRAHESGAVRWLLRYDDPDLHPELYAPENRYDDTHLNDAGARLFTEELARDFARIQAQARAGR